MKELSPKRLFLQYLLHFRNTIPSTIHYLACVSSKVLLYMVSSTFFLCGERGGEGGREGKGREGNGVVLVMCMQLIPDSLPVTFNDEFLFCFSKKRKKYGRVI